MHAKNLFVDQCTNGEAIEAIRKCFPETDVVSPFAFIVESVNAVYGGAFVVAAKKEEIFGVFNFIGEQQANGFQTLFASVDVITKKEVISFGREAAVLE